MGSARVPRAGLGVPPKPSSHRLSPFRGDGRRKQHAGRVRSPVRSHPLIPTSEFGFNGRRPEHQRCGSKPAQGNALGKAFGNNPSPERADYGERRRVGAPFQGSKRLSCLNPGRCPGLAWGWAFGPQITRRLNLRLSQPQDGRVHLKTAPASSPTNSPRGTPPGPLMPGSFSPPASP